MDYDFGDILDARNAPDGHFIVVVGQVSRKDKITKEDIEEIMYYKVTSHVYAVFKTILLYFNHCLAKKDPSFLKFYGKERDSGVIAPYGLLCQAVFLDRDTYYPACFETESMIVINCDPRLMDKKALETLKKDGKILLKDKLTKYDAVNLMNTIRHSKEVSEERIQKVGACFNKVKTTLK